MSWSDYTNYLRNKNACEFAAILSAEDGTLVAGDGFQVTQYNVEIGTDDDKGKQSITVNESANVIEIFSKGVCSSKAGFRLSGVKWQVVMTDLESGIIYLKKEKGGACMVKTSKTIVIGTWNAEQALIQEDPNAKPVYQNPGECNKAVEGLAKILKDNGY